ncbi:MAG TPA: ShlB/FhaC/HecB family hemolysin secretion/activation protein [Rhizomicrobium sp.]|nr:ShlB/FhaC/HecB family hemolysin secretion/activation protein [Rhizomicrobium sp.]
MRKVLVAMLAASLAGMPGYAWAQSTPFIIDQSRPDRARIAPAPKEAPIAPLPAEQALAGIKPFVLKSVAIKGSSLPPAALANATRSFIGKTIDANALGEIADAVSQAYAQKGDVALYTVAVPEQDFVRGTLILTAVEGYIEHVDLSGDVQGRLELVTKYATGLTKESPLTRSTFQRIISLIRDIPGLTVEAKLLRGNTPGAVRLLLVLKQRDWHLTLSADDMGSNPLGRVQMQARTSLYGLLREGEETALTIGLPLEAGRFQYVSLSETQAIDDNGTSVSGAYGFLRTRPRHSSPAGNANTLQFLLSHPLLRSYDENLYFTGSMDGIDSSNATLGEIVADERIRALRLSASYSSNTAKSAFALSASMNFGLNILGARTTDPLSAETAFKKAVVQASYNRLLGEEWIVRLRAATQLAFCRLPVSELYALGGANFASAFASASAFGDSALAGSAELAFRPHGLPGLLNGSEVFAFAEDGATWYRRRRALGPFDFHLASAGFGVRIPFREQTRLELKAANGLSADAPRVAPGKWRFGFTLVTSP